MGSTGRKCLLLILFCLAIGIFFIAPGEQSEVFQGSIKACTTAKSNFRLMVAASEPDLDQCPAARCSCDESLSVDTVSMRCETPSRLQCLCSSVFGCVEAGVYRVILPVSTCLELSLQEGPQSLNELRQLLNEASENSSFESKARCRFVSELTVLQSFGCSALGQLYKNRLAYRDCIAERYDRSCVAVGDLLRASADYCKELATEEDIAEALALTSACFETACTNNATGALDCVHSICEGKLAGELQERCHSEQKLYDQLSTECVVSRSTT